MLGTVVYKSHPSYLSGFMFLRVTRALFAIVIGGGILYALKSQEIISQFIFIVGVLALAIVSLILVHFVRALTKYTVSQSSVRIDHGIFIRRREEFHIRKVQAIDVRQNLIERFILRTGNLAFDSAAGDLRSGDREIIFQGVRNPHKVADIVRNADHLGSVGSFDGQNDPYVPPASSYQLPDRYGSSSQSPPNPGGAASLGGAARPAPPRANSGDDYPPPYQGVPPR